MALQEDIQTLIDFGVFNEGAVSKLANVIRTVQTLAMPASASSSASNSALDRIQEFEPGAKVAEAEVEAPRKRGKLSATPEELKKLYIDERMTAKEIAEKYGCAPGTVAIKLQKLGISKRAKTEAPKEKTKPAAKKK